MPRISIVPPEKSVPGVKPPGVAGSVETQSYIYGQSDPVHLHLLRLDDGGILTLEPYPIDRLCYIWLGDVEAGGCTLTSGSSFIVEHGASLDIKVLTPRCILLLFAAGHPASNHGEGGHVHLLPEDRVPRSGQKKTMVRGVGLHADGTCATCELWLQENVLPGMAEAPPDNVNVTGVHAHAEDEIIFVTRGQIRLGKKLYGPGTALAVAADTLYSFSPGPEGIEFLTFRPAKPSGIRYGKGSKMSEPAHWKDFPSLSYVDPVDIVGRTVGVTT